MSQERKRQKINAPWRVVEFYAGIGGMRYAIEACAKKLHHDVKTVASYEISGVCNDVYIHNFGSEAHYNKSIEKVSMKELNGHNGDIWLMSPPCQPYTRQGLQKGSEDPRAASFLHLLEIIKEMENPPTLLLMENVKGFDESESYVLFKEALYSRGYKVFATLMSPVDLGISNTRLRFFVVARRDVDKPFPVESEISMEPMIHNGIPGRAEDLRFNWDKHSMAECRLRGVWSGKVDAANTSSEDQNSIQSDDKSTYSKNSTTEIAVRHYMEDKVDFETFKVSSKTICKRGAQADIVKAGYCRSNCFTRAYGHYLQGTGSLLQTADDINTVESFRNHRDMSEHDLDNCPLTDLKIRYFTPREIANLHCFPPEFSFPKSITNIQANRMLGNSLNVSVVETLLLYTLQHQPMESALAASSL
eukprot:Clim_evm46s215 gene=Clim_evmTU46s215